MGHNCPHCGGLLGIDTYFGKINGVYTEKKLEDILLQRKKKEEVLERERKRIKEIKDNLCVEFNLAKSLKCKVFEFASKDERFWLVIVGLAAICFILILMSFNEITATQHIPFRIWVALAVVFLSTLFPNFCRRRVGRMKADERQKFLDSNESNYAKQKEILKHEKEYGEI